MVEPLPYTTTDDLPPLSTHILEAQTDKENAMRLIADSIAQQRQTAAYHLILHPFLLPPLAAALLGAYRYAWAYQQDLGTLLLTSCGVVMAYLLAIRYVTAGYIQAAEDLRWSWLSPSASATPAPSEQDMIIGLKFGQQLIGALVLRLEPSSSTAHASGGGNGRRRSRTSLLRGGRGVIRSWTVKLKYRGQGVGRDLLHEAVCITRERCGRDAEIGFAAEHANSKMVLPELFNAPFRRGERRAAKSLEKVLESAKKRRRL
jgi:GNAT superfamily N-acetyltransferase